MKAANVDWILRVAFLLGTVGAEAIRYAAVWMLYFAQALLLQSFLAGPSALLAYLPTYLTRVPREESMMAQQFGDEYRRYVARTGRLWPRIAARRAR